MSDNRTCIICNSKYHYCPSCSKDKSKPAWMTIFDKENCKNIYETCVAYRDKEIEIGEAKEKLNKLDLTLLEEFESGTRDLIKKILGNDKKDEVINVVIEPKEKIVSEGDIDMSNGSNSTSFIKKKIKKH